MTRYEMCVVCEVSKNLESLGEHTFECAKTRGVQPEVFEDLVKKVSLISKNERNFIRKTELIDWKPIY